MGDTHALVVDWRGVAFAEVEGRGITAYMCTLELWSEQCAVFGRI